MLSYAARHILQDGEIQECESHIATLEQQRGCKEEEVQSLRAEQQECGWRIQEFEAEVEKVTGKMEELQVSQGGCPSQYYFISATSFSLFPPFLSSSLPLLLPSPFLSSSLLPHL